MSEVREFPQVCLTICPIESENLNIQEYAQLVPVLGDVISHVAEVWGKTCGTFCIYMNGGGSEGGRSFYNTYAAPADPWRKFTRRTRHALPSGKNACRTLPLFMYIIKNRYA